MAMALLPYHHRPRLLLLLFFFFFLLLLLGDTASPPQRLEELKTKTSSSELQFLVQVKAALDPNGSILRSWVEGVDPCSSFHGVSCDAAGNVGTISLQGRGLKGFIPPAIAFLQHLTALYLHYNMLHGTIPSQLASLTSLTHLYLNVNLLTGFIPPHLASLSNLQSLELCCNGLQGSIPPQLGQLKKLIVLSLQHNNLTGPIPSSFGSMEGLSNLYLGFNMLSGPIPASLSSLSNLSTLDVQNNNLSGPLPLAFRSFQKDFLYGNNPLLCGDSFVSIPSCNASTTINKPKPMGSDIAAASDSMYPKVTSDRGSKASKISVISLVTPFAVGGIAVTLLSFLLFRRHKQRIGSTFEVSGKLCNENDPSIDGKTFGIGERTFLKCSSRSLGSLSGKGSYFTGSIEVYHYDLGELETATNYFSDSNLIGKNGYTAVYKGVLEDGSVAAIRSFSQTICKAGETTFREVVRAIAKLRHENIVSLKGFCFSSGTAECFLVYDYISNGNLQKYLEKPGKLLEWSTRSKIAYGIARGLDFMHRGTKEVVIHHNLCAANVLLDWNYNPFVADGGLHKLLAEDIVFAQLKASAAEGYLCPQYTTKGLVLDEKSNVYAFGVVLMQLLLMGRIDNISNSSSMVTWGRSLIGGGGVEMVKGGAKDEATMSIMAGIAFSCTNEDAKARPSMNEVVLLLGGNDAPSTTGGPSSSSSSSSWGENQEALFEHRLLYVGR